MAACPVRRSPKPWGCVAVEKFLAEGRCRYLREGSALRASPGGCPFLLTDSTCFPDVRCAATVSLIAALSYLIVSLPGFLLVDLFRLLENFPISLSDSSPPAAASPCCLTHTKPSHFFLALRARPTSRPLLENPHAPSWRCAPGHLAPGLRTLRSATFPLTAHRPPAHSRFPRTHSATHTPSWAAPTRPPHMPSGRRLPLRGAGCFAATDSVRAACAALRLGVLCVPLHGLASRSP